MSRKQSLVLVGGLMIAVLAARRSGAQEPGPTVSLAPSASVGEGGGSHLAFLRLTTPGGQALTAPVTISYTTLDGTATAPADYTATSGIVTFPVGATTGWQRTLEVPIVDDDAIEGNEGFTIQLTAITGGSIVGGTAQAVTIVDDDAAAAFSVAAQNVTEGGDVTITFTRTGNTNRYGCVQLVNVGGTATLGSDHDFDQTEILFQPGVNPTYTIHAAADALAEGEETISLALRALPHCLEFDVDPIPVGSPSTETIRILDDPSAAPAVYFSSAPMIVNEGAGNATIAVRRSGSTAAAVGVTVKTSNGSATAADYTPVTQVVTIPAGATIARMQVPIVADSLAEGDETFTLTLSAPTGGAVLGTQKTATVTIKDEGAPTVFVSPTAVVVQESPFSQAVATLTIGRSGPIGSTVGVTVSTAGVTATPGLDYTPVETVVTLGPGVMTQTVDIPIRSDDLAEGEETLSLALSNPTGGAVLGTQRKATVTIRDDDAHGSFPPVFFFAKTAVAVGEGAGGAVLTVKRSGRLTTAESVTLTTSNGTALAGSDYTAVTKVVSIAPGDTSAAVAIPILDDAVAEGDETFWATLGSPSGDSILGTQASVPVTIVDNETTRNVLAFLGVPAVSVDEGQATATFVVKRTGSTVGTVTVRCALGGGTATAGQDYVATSGTLAFANGVATQTFTVPILPDAIVEGDETVNATLSAPAAGADAVVPVKLGTQSVAVLTIKDDDGTLPAEMPAPPDDDPTDPGDGETPPDGA